MPQEEYNEAMEESEVPFDTEYLFTSDYCKECDHWVECLRESKEITVSHLAVNPDIKCERKTVTETVLNRMSEHPRLDFDLNANHKGENALSPRIILFVRLISGVPDALLIGG